MTTTGALPRRLPPPRSGLWRRRFLSLLPLHNTPQTKQAKVSTIQHATKFMYADANEHARTKHKHARTNRQKEGPTRHSTGHDAIRGIDANPSRHPHSVQATRWRARGTHLLLLLLLLLLLPRLSLRLSLRLRLRLPLLLLPRLCLLPLRLLLRLLLRPPSAATATAAAAVAAPWSAAGNRCANCCR